MKTPWLWTVSMVLCAASLARADAPALIPVQGRLADSSSMPIDGAHDLTFTIFDAQTEGAELFVETHGDTAVTDGVFSVYLGSVDPTGNPLDLSLFRDESSLWLEVVIDGTEVIEPRFRFGTVPYAAHAESCGSADAIDGAAVTAADVEGWDDAAADFGTHGSHAAAGYLTSYEETDPVFTTSEAANIDATDTAALATVATDASAWSAAATALDGATYTPSEWDAAYASLDGASYTPTEWDAAYSSLSGASYTPTEWDSAYASLNGASHTPTEWDTAYGWGDHAAAGYLTSDTLDDLSCADGQQIRFDAVSGNWQCTGLERVQHDDPRITFQPADFSCSAGNWCDGGQAWGANRFSDVGNFTECAGDADCSGNSVTLALDNNEYRSVLLAHLDWTNSRAITVHVSYDGGTTYQLHKRINTYRDPIADPHTSTIRTLISNLPVGINIRVRVVAQVGRMNFEGFALSKEVLPETPDDASHRASVFRYAVIDGAEYSVWTPLAYTAFTLVKAADGSRLKVTWTDSNRTISSGSNGACAWDLRIDGQPCSPQPILHVHHEAATTVDAHRAMTVTGVCEGVSAGAHTIQVYQKRRDGDEDCYRGHSASLAFDGTNNVDTYPATIIVEEIQ